MITAVHSLIYSDDAAATRAFFVEVLQWPCITETGERASTPDPEGWLIFATGPGELGVHPTVSHHGGQEFRSPRHHSLSLMCDDLEATMAELAGRGAAFAGEPQDMGFGLGVMVQVPGAGDLLVYQPRHTTAFQL